MPSPTRGDVHVNRPLSNISVAYAQRATDFIATSVFPIVPVNNRSDQYFIYSKASWLRSEAKKRAPGTESAGSGYDVETATYTADVFAVHKDVDDQIRSNADAPLDMDRDATEWVTHQMLLKRELEFVDSFFATSTWTGSTTGSDLTGGSSFTQWSDAASTPIDDITAQAIAIKEKTGFKPNVLVFGPEVWNKLRQHPDILDRIKYSQRGVVTNDLLAALFDVERVVVPMATRNTAVEGATASMDFVFGKSALLVYSAPSPSLMTPSGGYTFSWNGYLGASREGMRIKRFRMEQNSADRIEGEIAFDMKVVASDVGVFFTSAVA